MLYFSSVSNFPHGFLSTSGSITLKYSLGNGIEQSWKVKAKEKTNHNNKGKMSLEFGLKVVTIHYLYANE